VPVDKAADPVDAAAELAERRSLLHGGTLVTTGTAEAVVVATGDRTELGRISGLLGTVEPTQTPLTRDIARLGSTLTKVIGAVAVVLLGNEAHLDSGGGGRTVLGDPTDGALLVRPSGPGSTSPTCSTATRPARSCPSTPPAGTWRARRSRPTGRSVRRT
jgi:E1-E2 ATPase